MKILIATFTITTIICSIGWLKTYLKKVKLEEELGLIDKALEGDVF